MLGICGSHSASGRDNTSITLNGFTSRFMIQCRCPSCCGIFDAKSSAFGIESVCPLCGHKFVLDINILAHFQFPEEMVISLTDLNGQPVRQSGIRVKSKHGFHLLDVETDSDGIARITKQHYEQSMMEWDSFSIMDHPGDYSLVRYVTLWIEGNRSFGPVKVDLEHVALHGTVILEEKMDKRCQVPFMTGSSCNSQNSSPFHHRRSFLAKLMALLAGSVALITPAAVGIVAFLNPLRQKNQTGGFFRLTTLEAVPEDGSPQKFPVIADRTDAWNFFPNEPVGAVYLRRTGKDQVEAMQVVCPHAGCSIVVEASGNGKKFFCPCHSAGFDLSGKRLDATSPSPRDMDSMEVEIRDKNEVWVKFQKFATGTSKKVASG
jgi:menaquinol-cytochrome c reductase iron-sulfur subunit